MKTTTWSEKEISVLIDMYSSHNCSQIAEILGRTVIAVSSKAYYLKLKKPDNWKENPNAKKFTKGHLTNKEKPPHNKGKKQSEYMSAEAIAKAKLTQFKKGHTPYHAADPGDIRRHSKNNGNIKYQYIKSENNKWMPLQNKIWIEAYGKIPSNHFIVFKDKNPENLDISNLECITKQEHIERNRDSKYPEELKQLIRLNNKLKSKVWQKTKSLI